MPPQTNTASQCAHVQNTQVESLAAFLSSHNWTIPAGLKQPADSFSADDYGRHVRQRLMEDMRNAGLVNGIVAQKTTVSDRPYYDPFMTPNSTYMPSQSHVMARQLQSLQYENSCL
jgi:hypothetical protein